MPESSLNEISAKDLYDLVTKEDIEATLKELKKSNVKLRKGTDYNYIDENGFVFPPKDVLRHVAKRLGYAINEKTFYGGKANKPFERLGYQLVDEISSDQHSKKIRSLISKYKDRIKGTELKEELYKWAIAKKFHGHPDLNAEDFSREIASINYENLIYHNARGVLKVITEAKAEEVRDLFKHLFDESIDIQERLEYFRSHMKALYAEVEPRYYTDKLSEHQDERSIATYLATYDSNKYPYYKSSFYSKYCEYLGVKKASSGERYVHYLDLIQELTDYIREDGELLDMVSQFKDESSFEDNNYYILAQDILFQMFDHSDLSEEIRIIQHLKLVTKPYALKFYSLMDRLVNELGIEESDPRITYSFPKKDQMGMTIGQRYSFIIGSKYKHPYFGYIQSVANEEDWYATTDQWEEVEENWETLLSSAQAELDRTEKSGYAEHNSDVLERTIFDEEYRQEIFKKSFEETYSEEETHQSEKTMLKPKPTNRILYGPPGTGKTFKLKKEYFPLYTTSEASLTKDEFVRNIIKDLTWWQVIAIALIELKEASVTELIEHEFVKVKDMFSNTKTLRPTVWGDLQSHTSWENKYVNVKDRSEPFLFEKTAKSTWKLDDEVLRELGGEILSVYDKISSFKPSPGQIVKRYVFTTFHQSFSYEDFIEGIKPELNGDSEAELKYLIEPGVFYKICREAENDPNNRYAIFIDEINRGNVSAIFGELITLIEADKRKGQVNEMRATLPYSKQEFVVPPNLDIYGTMNTADRSVEALDTALRRRFEFEEMPPRPDLIGMVEGSVREISGIDLIRLLNIINQRIEKLIDKDHMIGHSYFLQVSNMNDLKLAFQNKIIPLLQEYFFGDYGKIGLVLGEGFVSDNSEDNENIFAEFNGYDTSGLNERAVYMIKDVAKMDDETFVLAIIKLMEHPG